MVAPGTVVRRNAAILIALSNCPQNCPCDAPKQRVQSQRQPTRSIGEVENSEGFTRKIENVREASFRLANRRLQPLGHLTAARNVSIRHGLGYGNALDCQIVPKIVPADSENPPLNPGGSGSRTPTRRQRFLWSTTMPQRIAAHGFTRMSRRPHSRSLVRRGAEPCADPTCAQAVGRRRPFEPLSVGHDVAEQPPRLRSRGSR